MGIDKNLFDMELVRSDSKTDPRLHQGPLYKRYFFRFISFIKRKKQEQITLMLIPHNEKKIRSMHLSNLALGIFIAVVSLVVIVSSVLIAQHNSTVKKVDKLKISQKDAKLQFSKIQGEIQEISSLYSQLRDKLNTLQNLTSNNTAKEEYSYGIGGFAVPIGTDESNTENDRIPNEIYLMNRITSDMSSSEDVIDSIKKYLKKRSKVISSTPTLWPVSGSVINPFGMVRNSHDMKLHYNRGVDIATVPGSNVVSTAPGVIISIKKDQYWQYVVRIRHNFGYETTYKGMQKVLVEPDSKVSKGSIIGIAGTPAGLADSVIHYEIYIGSEAQNPLPYLSYIKEVYPSSLQKEQKQEAVQD